MEEAIADMGSRFVIILAVFLAALVIISAVGMMIYIYIRWSKRSRREKNLEKQIEAYDNQIQIMTDAQKQMKMFRHDIRHHLIVLGGLASDSHDMPVLRYIEEIEGYLEQTKEYVFTGKKEIDSILNYIIKQAKDNGVEITWKVEVPAEISVKSFDLTAILGNLLENAVQGALKTEEKWMNIFLRADESILYIRIENSCKEPPVNKDGRLLTTKRDKDEHGIGLYSVQSMVDKNNGTLKLDCSRGRFAAEVLLYL